MKEVKNKNILICLDQIGIGGVETAVVNQAISLKEIGYNVFVLTKKDVYEEILEKNGIKVIDFTYNCSISCMDEKQTEKVVNIIKKYDIGQVHIHKLDCISTMLPACLLTKIPYVAYIHTGILGTYDPFITERKEGHILELFFKKATKLVAITEMAKNENQKKFNIPDEKYIILRNSINFENVHPVPRKISPINHFLLVSRLSPEKKRSIVNAIRVYKHYNVKHPDSKLLIAGDGIIMDEIKERAEDVPGITFLGKRNDILDLMNKVDVVLGTDRCMLETLSMKRIAFISGYEQIRGIIKPSNIDTVAHENFAGRTLNKLTLEEAVQQLEEINAMPEKELNEMIEKNYEYVYEKLNSKKNIYYIKEYDEHIYDITMEEFVKYMEKSAYTIDDVLEINKKLFIESQEGIKFYLNQSNMKDEIIKKQDDQINTFFYFKLRSKLENLKHRIGSKLKRMIKNKNNK